MLIGTSFSAEGSVASCPKMITLHTDLPSWEVCMQCMSEIGKKRAMEIRIQKSHARVTHWGGQLLEYDSECARNGRSVCITVSL